jgi:hypothetical protein
MWKYVLAWLPMVFIAIGNGAIREGWYGKYLSELQAHQLSTCRMKCGANMLCPSCGSLCFRGGDFLDDPVAYGKELLQYRFILQDRQPYGRTSGNSVRRDDDTWECVETLEQFEALGFCLKGGRRFHHLKLDLDASVGPHRNEPILFALVVEHWKKTRVAKSA